MTKLTKKQKSQVGKVDGNKLYALADAWLLVKSSLLQSLTSLSTLLCN